MKKALLALLLILAALVAYCSYPTTSVSAITLSLVDQAGDPVTGPAQARFLDAAGAEIVTVSLETRGSWANTLHWWAHSDHAQSLKRPEDAARAVRAEIEAEGCAAETVPIRIERHYEPLSFAPHGGGPASWIYTFERQVVLDCGSGE